MPSKPTRKPSSDPGRESSADSVASAIGEQLVGDVAEAIAECKRTWRREDEEAEFGPDPMQIAKRKIRDSIVAACRKLAQLAIAQRRDPQGWADAKIHELDATIAEEYPGGYFDLDKIRPEAIARGLHESKVLIAGAVRAVSPVPRPPVRSHERNERKSAIARIKAGTPRISSRHVCVQMDNRMARVQSEYTRGELRPLAQWIEKTKDKACPAGKGTWAELYDDDRTHNPVKSYIDKVPPLSTRKA